MNGCSAACRSDNEDKHLETACNQYYSVEFSITDDELLYQFKLRNSASQSMFILVKENSEILRRIKKGLIFKTKYYSTDSLCSTVDSETQIKEITKDKNGRFKGHYLVGLDILSMESQSVAH